MAPTTASGPERTWTEGATSAYRAVHDAVEPAIAYPLSKIPHEAQTGLLIVGTVGLTLAASAGYKRFLRRIPNSDAVSVRDFERKRWIKGVVTSVGDADNFRLYHTPGIGWRFPLKFRFIPHGKDLKDKTLHIRMAGADAPEAAHFGKPSQPYSAEALAWLRNRVLNKRVWCQLIRRDQYGRTVAVPLMPTFLPFRHRNVSLEMIRAGWAMVYDQMNAEYGKEGKEQYLAAQAAAKAARRGMWEHGTDGETPAEYKKRYATTGTLPPKA